MNYPNCDCGLTGGCEICNPWPANVTVGTFDTQLINRKEYARLLRIEEAAERLCLEHGTYKVLFNSLREALRTQE